MRKRIIVLSGNEEESKKRFRDGLSLYYQNRGSEMVCSGIGLKELIGDELADAYKRDEQLKSNMIFEPLSTSTKENMENSVALIGDDVGAVDFVGGSRQIAEMKIYARRRRKELEEKDVKFYGTSEIFNRYMPMNLLKIYIAFVGALLGEPGEKITRFLKKTEYRGRV